MEKVKKYRWVVMVAGVIAISVIFAALIISLVGYTNIGLFIWGDWGDRPGVIIDQEQCDMDFDGDCDRFDFWLFSRSIGQCIDGDNYNEPADADHDGCVTPTDQKILFPNIPIKAEE